MTKLFAILTLIFFAFGTGVAFAQAQGGMEGGGGNTYKNRPLESYIEDPTVFTPYLSVIAPLLIDLRIKAKSERDLGILANLLEAIFRQKVWYFVPGPLDQVPADLLNAAVRTDQAALQNYDQVWVDSNIWKQMNAEDQARLLVHEAFMGMKVLQFGRDARQCSAAYLRPAECVENGTVDKTLALTSLDYLQVQKVTAQVSRGVSGLTPQQWLTLIRENHFEYTWSWFKETQSMSVAEFKQSLIQSRLTGYMPSYGFNLRGLNEMPQMTREAIYQFTQDRKESCNVQAEVEGSQLTLNLRGASENLALKIPLKDQVLYSMGDLLYEGKRMREFGFMQYSGQIRPQGGYTVYNIFLGLDDYALSHLYIQEMVCEQADCHDSPALDVRGGLLYTCTMTQTPFRYAR